MFAGSQQPPRPRRSIAAADSTDEEEVLAQQRDNFTKVADMARDAYDLSKQLAGLINVETKVMQVQGPPFQPTSAALSFPYGVANPGGTGVWLIQNDITQGIGDEANRVGDSIKCQHFNFRGKLTCDAAASLQYQTRIVLVWDQDAVISQVFSGQTGGVVPPITDTQGIFDISMANTTNAPYAFRDFDSEAKNVHFLYDKIFHTSGSAGSDTLHFINFNVKINRHTKYELGTRVVNTGALKLMVIGSASSADTLRPTLNFAYRLYYTDD